MDALRFFFSVVFLEIVSATEPEIFGKTNDVSFSNFIPHEGYKLSGSPLKKVNLDSFFDCLIECTANSQCLSTNVNTTSDVQGLLGCELLGIDKYQHEENLTKVKGVDHYALPSKCASSPCKNNGKCVSLYSQNSYKCKCPTLKEGPHCEKDCSKPFGMEDGRIKDYQITASSCAGYYILFRTSYGRLNDKRGCCWQPQRMQALEYLQIDLGSKKSIHKVATQGRHDTNWGMHVTSFVLKYSDDGSTWTDYTVDGAINIFTANVDQHTVKSNILPAPFKARYVRFVVQTWFDKITLRVEVYGC